MHSYKYEYTDTFAGERNYGWVHTGTVEAAGLKDALRKARRELGLTGVRGDIVEDFGDAIGWKPRGRCSILSVN